MKKLLIIGLIVFGCKDRIEPEIKCPFDFIESDYEQYSSYNVCAILNDTSLIYLSEKKYQYAVDLIATCYPENSIYLCD